MPCAQAQPVGVLVYANLPSTFSACQVHTYLENSRDTLCIQIDHSGIRRQKAEHPGGRDEHFFAWMIIRKNDDHFICDNETFQDPSHGPRSDGVYNWGNNKWLLLSCT